jgi:hypothetical protein
MVSKKTKPHRSKRVVFTKHQYEAFAKKLNKWTGALPPEERAIMIAALDRGLNVVRRAGDKSEYTATPINLEMTREFNLGQFIVEVLLLKVFRLKSTRTARPMCKKLTGPRPDGHGWDRPGGQHSVTGGQASAIRRDAFRRRASPSGPFACHRVAAARAASLGARNRPHLGSRFRLPRQPCPQGIARCESDLS